MAYSIPTEVPGSIEYLRKLLKPLGLWTWMIFGTALASAAATETGPVQTFDRIPGRSHAYLTSALLPIGWPNLSGNFLGCVGCRSSVEVRESPIQVGAILAVFAIEGSCWAVEALSNVSPKTRRLRGLGGAGPGLPVLYAHAAIAYMVEVPTGRLADSGLRLCLDLHKRNSGVVDHIPVMSRVWTTLPRRCIPRLRSKFGHCLPGKLF